MFERCVSVNEGNMTKYFVLRTTNRNIYCVSTMFFIFVIYHLVNPRFLLRKGLYLYKMNTWQWTNSPKYVKFSIAFLIYFFTYYTKISIYLHTEIRLKIFSDSKNVGYLKFCSILVKYLLVKYLYKNYFNFLKNYRFGLFWLINNRCISKLRSGGNRSALDVRSYLLMYLWDNLYLN
jgi:hypothetical protein